MLKGRTKQFKALSSGGCGNFWGLSEKVDSRWRCWSK